MASTGSGWSRVGDETAGRRDEETSRRGEQDHGRGHAPPSAPVRARLWPVRAVQLSGLSAAARQRAGRTRGVARHPLAQTPARDAVLPLHDPHPVPDLDARAASSWKRPVQRRVSSPPRRRPQGGVVRAGASPHGSAR